jgi:sugar transferase EpsL
MKVAAETAVSKRAIDIVLTSLMLVVLMPFMIALATLVRLGLGAPVLFRQVRPGLHGRPFTLLKFRTMRAIRSSDGSLLPDSERLTRAGRFLRELSLDELPQLFNVLRGDMSLVGPRPLLMDYVGRYSAEQSRRHLVRPGITGWAQVKGRNELLWCDRFSLDCWYVDNRSIWLDFEILGLTIWRVLSRRGISAPGHATMPEFHGEDNS